MSIKQQRWLRRLGILSVLMLLGWLGSSALVAWLLTHRPHPLVAEPPPTMAGLNIEQLRLDTSDGEQIGGWFIAPQSKPDIFLLLHGNGSSRSEHLAVLQSLANEGYGVLAISLRAHGDSTGSCNDIGLGASHDVVAAVNFIEHRCPKQPIVIAGVSLGAAAAAYAADTLKDRVSAYVLESVYSDLKSATWNRLRINLPPLADVAAYTGLMLWSGAFLPHPLDEYSPAICLGKIPQQIPVYMLGGTADRYALPSETQQMFDSIRSHATLTQFAGADHVDLFSRDPERYMTVLRAAAAKAKY